MLGPLCRACASSRCPLARNSSRPKSPEPSPGRLELTEIRRLTKQPSTAPARRGALPNRSRSHHPVVSAAPTRAADGTQLGATVAPQPSVVKLGVHPENIPLRFTKSSSVATIEQKLGRRIAQLRQRGEMTQAQLAEAAGYSEDFIGLVERGINAPAVSGLERIARALRVPSKTYSASDLWISAVRPTSSTNSAKELPRKSGAASGSAVQREGRRTPSTESLARTPSRRPGTTPSDSRLRKVVPREDTRLLSPPVLLHAGCQSRITEPSRRLRLHGLSPPNRGSLGAFL